ncbi:MAG: zinc ribbon domain-containing protein [Chloroflexi bacterium]|nr:MAG: zinc ribbon domain-containing protein [Chloroflexota bacterium]RLC92088.1 MAG: zinc ribbon domain-containing protein [Chloroflexota bacterium]HEY68564.1 zinc ribbon domain-containing protein [Thermoflexia bacterium]
MPVYEYCCTECGERFELFVRSAAQQIAPTCPRCGSPKVQKAISLFGVGGTGGRSKTSTASCGPSPV